MSNLITEEWDGQEDVPRPNEPQGNGAHPRGGRLPEVVSGTNPLVRVANRLINLIPQIRAMPRVDDIARLHERLAAEIRLFEQRAQEAGVAREQIVGARYCLCTVIDETAAQTPWGGSGDWAKRSLLVTFHNETWGGEKYFQLLSRLAQNPEKHRDLLELMFFCIELGFEGRFRVLEGGRAQLETLRQRLATILATVQGAAESALSPHWKGDEGRLGQWQTVPVWVVAAICGLLALVFYLILAFRLADRSDPVFAALAAIEVPALARGTGTPDRLPTPNRFRGFLEPEIREGLVEVVDNADRSVVTLLGDGLFHSGSAQIDDRYRAVLLRVGEAINGVSGGVAITGYTDSVPTRSVRFPSNWHLSQARADAVEDLMDRVLDDPQRTRADGRGEADPVADNATAAGRARNRRVEITVLAGRHEIAAMREPARLVGEAR